MRIGLPEQELKQHNTTRRDGPTHACYGTFGARLLSYDSWPSTLKQNPLKLSEAGFFYTGKSLRGQNPAY